MLMTIALDLDDEEAVAALIQANVDAMTGPVAIVTTVVRELTPFLDHPRLGTLIRRLTLWATRDTSRRPGSRPGAENGAGRDG